MRSWSCDMRYSGPSNLHVWDLLQIHTNGTDNIFLFSKVCTLLPFFVIWESWILILTFYSGCLIYSIILQISASSEVSDKPVVVLITWSRASDWLSFCLTHLAFSSAGSVRTSFELLDSGWIVKMTELSLLCKYYAWVQQSNRVVCPTCHVRVKFICVCVCPASSLVTHSVSLLTHWCICVFAAFLVIFNAPKRPFDIPAVWGLVWYTCCVRL